MSTPNNPTPPTPEQEPTQSTGERLTPDAPVVADPDNIIGRHRRGRRGGCVAVVGAVIVLGAGGAYVGTNRGDAEVGNATATASELARDTLGKITVTPTASPNRSPVAPVSAKPEIDDTLKPGEVQSAWNKFVREATQPMNPEAFKDGQQLGAIIIEYKNNPKRPWSLIDKYYTDRGIPKPKQMNNPFVHRIVAGMPTDKNLANGAVMDTRSSSEEPIVAFHTVTPVKAAESVNMTLGNKDLKGTFEQTEMGINAELMPGDVVHIVMPTSKHGWLTDRRYVVESKSILPMYTIKNGKKVLNQEGINALFTNHKSDLAIYECWEPGSDQKRLVIRLRLTSATVAQGSVGPVGKAQLGGHNL